MLNLVVVQILSGVFLGVGALGFVLWRSTFRRPREALHVKARRIPVRSAEITWMSGALVMVLWPVGVLVLPEFAYHWPNVSDIPLSWAIQLVGFAISTAGGLLFFTAARALGRFLTPEIQVQEGHRLVQEGPYRYIRHPVYTAGSTVGIGLSALYLSPVLAGIVLVLACIANYRARVEEALLSSPDAFGSVYSKYMSRTGRFLPRFHHRREHQ